MHYAMRIFASVTATMLSLAACSEPGTITTPVSSALSAKGPGSAPEAQLAGGRVCKYVLSRRPPTARLLDYTASAGGRTCYQNGTTILFLPARGPSCKAPAAFDVERSHGLSASEAEKQYISCSALFTPRHGETGQSVIYRPSDKATEEDDGFFIQFGLDMGALVSNDGLPVSAYQVEEYEVCVETDVPAEVDRRVRESDIVNFDFVDVEFRSGSCQTT